MDDLVTWLRQQLDDDERWALAANQPYPYAKPPAVAPAGGVHWRWVAGEDWHTVTPDPVVDEFVAEPGYPCNLATVEEWPSGHHCVPRTYANDIIEMDSAAAGHIIRHDPARVLREVEAKRIMLALAIQMLTPVPIPPDTSAIVARIELIVEEHERKLADRLLHLLHLLALPYADRDGYREEWKP